MKKCLSILAVGLAAGLALMAPTSALAQAGDPTYGGNIGGSGGGNAAAEAIRGGANKTGLSEGNNADASTIIKNVTNVLLFIIGAVSVIMMIFGGIKYTTSNGDAGRISSAKNTIMYSIVGLLVAIFAYAIVGFIIDNVAK